MKTPAFKALSTQNIERVFQYFLQSDPTPSTDLHYHSAFQLLIAVLLSARSTDRSVNQATQALFAIAKTPADFIALGEMGLKAYLKTIGLYPTKIKHILATSALLLAYPPEQLSPNGLPQTREALEQFPGVGRKTANVLLNTLFGQDTIAVDTHVFRVAQRLGLASGRTPLELEQALYDHIPQPYIKNTSHWLIHHGRAFCPAQRPRCLSCPLSSLCRKNGLS